MQRRTSKEEDMNRTETLDLLPRELAYRANDGLEVWLLWTRLGNRLSLVVKDSSQGVSFELDVDPARALDAFHHPYAYAASGGIDFVAPRRRDDTLVPA
jgi:hypothetical protein